MEKDIKELRLLVSGILVLIFLLLMVINSMQNRTERIRKDTRLVLLNQQERIEELEWAERMREKIPTRKKR